VPNWPEATSNGKLLAPTNRCAILTIVPLNIDVRRFLYIHTCVCTEATHNDRSDGVGLQKTHEYSEETDKTELEVRPAQENYRKEL